MKRGLQEKEIAVLECLESATTSLGSWSLVELLERRGVSASPATVGRLLNSLEHMGCAEKEGHNGRVITPAGRAMLVSAKAGSHIKEHAQALEQLIATTTLEDYILVLEARQAIERQTARLAAEKITREELDEIQGLLDKQRDRHRQGRSIADIDISFHQAIARASRNKVLEALYLMLFTYGQQTTIFEHIRKQVDAVYMTSHQQIFQALENRDPDRAERCMSDHLNSLIEDVTRYWDMFYEEEAPKEIQRGPRDWPKGIV